jgi:hypothetical protein
MIIVAPSISASLRDVAERLGLTLHPREDGVITVTGASFPLWIIETDRLAAISETALAFFSREFLTEPRAIIEHWQETGRMAILQFILQQIQ